MSGGRTKPPRWAWRASGLHPVFRNIATGLQSLLPLWDVPQGTNTAPGDAARGDLWEVINPSATYPLGQVGVYGPHANYDDGGSQYLRRSVSPGLDFTGHFTILYFGRKDSTATRTYMAMRTESGEGDLEFYTGKPETGLTVALTKNRDNGGTFDYVQIDAQSWALGEWACYVGRFNGIYGLGPSRAQIFRDGVEQPPQAGTNYRWDSTEGPLNTGSKHWVTGQAMSFANENHDQTVGMVAIWNRALSDTEILTVSNDPFGLIRPSVPLAPQVDPVTYSWGRG